MFGYFRLLRKGTKMERREPVVKLVDHTSRPVETLYILWEASKSNRPLSDIYAEIRIDPAVRIKARRLLSQVLASTISVAQSINFVFMLENISVSFREQLVRHKIGSRVGPRVGVDTVPDLAESVFWSQSMRILPMGDFADSGMFRIPDCVRDCQTKLGDFNSTPRDPEFIWLDLMNKIQYVYRLFVGAGMPTEEVRDCLPLGCLHRVSWTVNLVSLSNILHNRSCWIPQASLWSPVLKGVAQELLKIDPIFSILTTPPCVGVKTDAGDDPDSSHVEFHKGCPYELENVRRLAGEDVTVPCPIWEKVFSKRDAESKDTLPTDKRALQAKMAKDWSKTWCRDAETGFSLG